MSDENKYPSQSDFESVTGGLSQGDLYGMMCDMRQLADRRISSGWGVYAQGLPHYVRPDNLENNSFNKAIVIETFDQDPRNQGSQVLRRTSINSLGADTFNIFYEDLEHGKTMTGSSSTPVSELVEADHESALWFVPKDQWEALRLIKPSVDEELRNAPVQRRRGFLRWIMGRD